MIGKRIISPQPKTHSVLAELPPPASVEVFAPETGTPVPSATPEPTPVKMISTGRGGYTVAVGAFQHSKNAWNERARFRNLGYPAVVQKRGKYYRVQIGQYSSLMSAKVSAAQLNKKGIAGYATRF